MENWEAIVVDDGSSPDEWNRARQFADDRITYLQRTDGQKGPSRCRNMGLQNAAGSLVIFLDSDDFMAPWALSQRVNWMSEHSEAPFSVFPVMLFSNSPGDQNTLWNSMDGDDELNRFLKSDPPWHTSSPVWRRQAILDLGGFNEKIMYGDDSDLHMRALLSDFAFAKNADALPDVFIRRADDSRITNTLSEQLLDSRLVRLEQGSAVLNADGTPDQQRAWEGQYFVETEFLLFNCEGSRDQQIRVLEAWKSHHSPDLLKRMATRTYFKVARMTRNRAYFALRIARRIAMLVLPDSYFSKSGEFESACLSAEQYQDVRTRLQQAS